MPIENPCQVVGQLAAQPPGLGPGRLSEGTSVAEHSRRAFITRGSVGAAAVGAAAVGIPLLDGQKSATPDGPLHNGPFAAWVKDAKTGEVAVMVGSQTIVHVDKRLAGQLARIAGSAPKR